MVGTGNGERGGVVRGRPPERFSAAGALKLVSAAAMGGQKGDAGGRAADDGHGMQNFKGGCFGGGGVHGGGSDYGKLYHEP